MSAPPGLVQDHLRRWREDLIDLSKRNRLLYFKHLRSGSLEFEQDARTLLDGLGGRGASAGWGFHIPPDPPDEPGLLDPPDPPHPRSDDLVIAARQGKTGKQIERSLRTLARKAQAEFLDAGLWVLYVGLGFLRWKDRDDEVSSPLYLLPVRLEQRQGHRAWRLIGSDDGEPALNPSLAVRLERDGIVLPALDELEDDSYRTAVAAVRHAERELSHWTPDWSRLDPTAANSLDQMRSRMAEFDPAPDIGHTSTYRLSSNEGHLTESGVTPGALETHTSTQLCALRDALDGAARIIETLNSAAMELVTAFGVSGAVSPIVLDRLAKLGELANSETPPEPDWFHDGPLEAAREAHRVLSEIVPPYIAQRDDLMQDHPEAGAAAPMGGPDRRR